MFGLLKATFSHVIIDLSKRYNRVDMAALQAANHVLLVTQLDLPCLRNVVRLMMSFEADGGLKDKIKIVVNRVGLDNGHISLKKAKETIGRDIFWRLPNDYRVMVEMRNNGVPLIEQAPRRPSRRRLSRWPSELSGVERGDDDTSADSKGRWLAFWGKNKTRHDVRGVRSHVRPSSGHAAASRIGACSSDRESLVATLAASRAAGVDGARTRVSRAGLARESPPDRRISAHAGELLP